MGPEIQYTFILISSGSYFKQDPPLFNIIGRDVKEMSTVELLKHIYDINLSYLLLAQRLINQEKASAMFRLGISDSMADALKELTLPQLVKLAETNQLICNFRFEDSETIEQLTKESRVDDFATNSYWYPSFF